MRTVRRGGTSFRVPAAWRELDGLAREIEQRFARPGSSTPLLASAFGDRSAGLFVVLLEVVSRPEVGDAEQARTAFREALESAMKPAGARLLSFEESDGNTHFVARAEGSIVHARTLVSIDGDGLLHLIALLCVRARDRLSVLDTLCHEMLASLAPPTVTSPAQSSGQPDLRLDGDWDAGPLRVPAGARGPRLAPSQEEPDRLGLFLLAGGGILLLLAAGFMYLALRREPS